MEKVRILGAGPAGLSASISLAKEGYDVEIYERNKDVGYRFNGDLQGIENWSKKEDITDEFNKMKIKINFEADPFKRITATNGKKINEVKNSKRPLYYLVKRGNATGSLDAALRDQAQDNGIKFHFESTLPDNKVDIIATGPVLKHKVGIVKGITFKTDLEDTATVLFNNKAAFKGYAYLLVTKGYATMSTVLLDKFNTINKCFDNTKKIFSDIYEFKVENSKKCGGIGCFMLNNKFKNGNSLLVGEAAGLQDMFLGFGLRYAINSGFLAKRSIIEGIDYDKLIKSNFANKLKAGLVNRYLWEKTNKNNYSIIVNNFGWIIRNFHWISNYNIFQRILYPFALSKMKKRYSWLE